MADNDVATVDDAPMHEEAETLTASQLESEDRLRHLCSFCLGYGDEHTLLACTECGSAGHQRCLKFKDALWATCKAAPSWACMECKVCGGCKTSGNDVGSGVRGFVAN